MPIEIVDDQAMASALQRAFEDRLPEAIFINIHYIRSPHGTSMDFEGLDIAIEKAKEGKPIILYGTETKEWMMRDSRFVELMSKGNVGFITAPFRHEEVEMLYHQLKHE